MITFAALALSIAMLDTPTPTPTPGPNNSPISGFYVDNQQPLPWDIPAMPTFGTGTPIATLYASTPPHSTDYPHQIETATAQIDIFTGPVGAVSTPVAALVGVAPTPDGSNINTGLDPVGTGIVSISSLTDEITAEIDEVVGVARAFVMGFLDLASYSPWMAPIMVMLVITATLDVWVGMIITLLKAISFLFNFVVKVAGLAGVWIR